MNRRAFLGAVSAAVGALAFDPERLLWVPGQRRYFDIVRPLRITDPLTGISMRLVRDFTAEKTLNRFDVIFSWPYQDVTRIAG